MKLSVLYLVLTWVNLRFHVQYRMITLELLISGLDSEMKNKKASSFVPRRDYTTPVGGWVGSSLVPRVATWCHHWTATTTTADAAVVAA